MNKKLVIARNERMGTREREERGGREGRKRRETGDEKGVGKERKVGKLIHNTKAKMGNHEHA